MVLTVVDGDTIEIATASGAIKVRVIGIDSPETVHPYRAVEPFGPEASKRARGLLLGKTVRIQYDPGPTHDKWGKYGRLLAYIELPDGRDFGLVMITEGMARAYRNYRFSRMSEYVQVEQNARAAQAGMWATSNAPALGVH
jgi:micrococcal nuclease